jgi:hypothetical protein
MDHSHGSLLNKEAEEQVAKYTRVHTPHTCAALSAGRHCWLGLLSRILTQLEYAAGLILTDKPKHEGLTQVAQKAVEKHSQTPSFFVCRAINHSDQERGAF